MTVLDEGFFHALQQDPADDATRLVYADFLEEYGDAADAAHADLIRVQLELAALAPSCRLAVERAAQLTQRQDDLLERWERVWLGDWAGAMDGWAFRRGFVEAVRADASIFLEHAPAWFAQWPTLSVAKLTRAGGHLPELASSPWLAHLRGLDLADNGIDSGELAHLTASRFVCLLRALDLSGNPIGPRGAMLLAGAPCADELSELHLARCGLGWQGLEGLIDGAPRWRRLDLSHNGLDRRDAVRLVDSPVMRNLVALDLTGNRLGDNGASALADSPGAAGLIDLGLCDTGTGNSEVTALATSPHLPKLRSLDLRWHHCSVLLDRQREDRGGIAELSRSPLLGQLRRLLLTPNANRNDWTAEVMNIARPPRRLTVTPAGWVANRLRSSRYLMPSQLVECDVEELWWLGDTSNRERLPNPWLDDGRF